MLASGIDSIVAASVGTGCDVAGDDDAHAESNMDIKTNKEKILRFILNPRVRLLSSRRRPFDRLRTSLAAEDGGLSKKVSFQILACDSFELHDEI